MDYKEIIVARMKTDAQDLLDEFERRNFKFVDETAEDYVNIFGDEDLNEMCSWIDQMDQFLNNKEDI